MDKLFTPQNIKIIANSLSNHKKERFDTILDPLQCIIQLALLSFCPIGTKISIENNILSIQQPCYSQGLVRWYKNDNKDDLFYLFYSCKRFPSYYNSLKNITYKKQSLYDVLIKYAISGLDNLSETYCKADNPALLHTFEIYKTLIQNSSNSANDVQTGTQTPNHANSEIENVFIKIRNVYDNSLLNAILHILLLIVNDTQNYNIYISSLYKLLTPTHEKITVWIHNNVLF